MAAPHESGGAPPTPLERFRAEKDRYFREDPGSPVERDSNFDGLRFYPEDPAWVLVARWQPPAGTDPVVLPTSAGDHRGYLPYAHARFEIGGEPHALTLYAGLDDPEPDKLFLPFLDATSGSETYGGGRYLDVPLDDGARREPTLVLDFNYAYHPLCLFTPRYSCVLAPPHNRLTLAVRAGERL